MKKIFKKLVAKSDIRPELCKVLVTPKFLVCTDSFSLIEVSTDCFKDDEKIKLKILSERFSEKVMVKPDELDLECKILEVLPVGEQREFPDYKSVLPTDKQLESDDYNVVTIDPVKLANLAKAISDTYGSNKFSKVQLYVPKKGNKPLAIKRSDGKAIGVLMPINE